MIVAGRGGIHSPLYSIFTRIATKRSGKTKKD